MLPVARSGSTTAYKATYAEIGMPSSSTPVMDGTAAIGTSLTWARADHVHPTDTTRAPLASPALTGTPTAPTASVNTSTTQIATTAYVLNQASAAVPAMDGPGAAGAATAWSRGDHVHPTDTSRAPLASPTFTGTPAAPTPATADNSTTLATTAFVQTAVAPALNDQGRNLLHNSRFNIQQRGTGPWTTGVYTADRWVEAVASDAISITLASLADADRTAIGDESAGYALQNVFTGNAAAGAYNFLVQNIESVRRLSGRTVTVSLWAKASAGTPKLGLNIQQVFGTGGSPSAGVWAQSTGSAVTLSTTWTRYTVTISVPGTSGKTLGTNNDNYSQLAIFYSCGATNNATAGNIGVQSGTVQLWGVQLEIGSGGNYPTPLETIDPVRELQQCQRFYVANQYMMLGGYASATGQVMWQTCFFPVTLRATPSLTFSGWTYANGSTIAATQNTASSSALTFNSTATGLSWAQGFVNASADL